MQVVSQNNSFIARIRRRGKVLEITVPRKLARELGLTHGTYVEFTVTRILFKPSRSVEEKEDEEEEES
jgi:antitoxin component of MazEF toxin-antitoxin module